MSRLGCPFLHDRDGLPLFSLREVNRLATVDKEALYARLIPVAIFAGFGVDRQTLRSRDDRCKIRFIAPEGLGLVRIEVKLHPDDRDPLFFVELADTPYGQIELSFCLVNDPAASRFDIDRDSAGRDTCFGTLCRNVPEELRAMAAGLAPHQVRRGLKMFRPFFHRLERFVDALGIDTIVAEPLSYDNAIRYEGYGFDYIAGRQMMLWIDREFRPGGELRRRLDGSTPFRQPGMENWAIHDGILGRPWDGVRIYKTAGVDAGIDTFPDRIY